MTTIYTFSSYDAFAFHWNARLYENLQYKNLFLKNSKDISPLLKQKLNITYDISLRDLSLICNCSTKNHHRALDDTFLLKNVAQTILTNSYDKTLPDAYFDYRKQRDAYIKLNSFIKNFKEYNSNSDQLLDLVLTGKPFSEFLQNLI